MRAIIQRVSRAAVRVEHRTTGEIGAGLLVLVGVSNQDTDTDVRYTAEKIAHLRIFPDETGRMDRSALDVGAAVLVVSQFTLYGDARKGRRPSYSDAAGGDAARLGYEAVCQRLGDCGLLVETGEFGADMRVEMVGEGPVTILLDSTRQF